MEKILSEEYECGGPMAAMEATFRDIDVSTSLNMTKVNVKDKDAMVKRFNVMFKVRGTAV